MNTNNLPWLHNLIGLHHISNTQSNDKYPPYNLFMIDDDTYCMEIAVTGFKKEEISVEVEKDRLDVRAISSDLDLDTYVEDTRYLHRGLAKRSFHKVLTMVNFEVDRATHENGLLTIFFKRISPELSLRKRIEIV